MCGLPLQQSTNCSSLLNCGGKSCFFCRFCDSAACWVCTQRAVQRACNACSLHVSHLALLPGIIRQSQRMTCHIYTLSHAWSCQSPDVILLVSSARVSVSANCCACVCIGADNGLTQCDLRACCGPGAATICHHAKCDSGRHKTLRMTCLVPAGCASCTQCMATNRLEVVHNDASMLCPACQNTNSHSRSGRYRKCSGPFVICTGSMRQGGYGRDREDCKWLHKRRGAIWRCVSCNAFASITFYATACICNLQAVL